MAIALRKNANRIKQGSVVVDVVLFIITIMICIVTLYPFYFVIIMSISSPLEAAGMNVFWYPKGFFLGSYELIVQDTKMWWAYSNTIIYVVAGTVLNCLMAVSGAYPLTVRNLKGRKWVVAFLLIPMYFGGGLIPSFLLVYKLGMYNTMLAVIVPGMVSIWNIILVRTYFTTIPDGLKESAFMDGASHWQLLFRIILPVSKPIIAVIAIYTIVGIWNSWFDALVYLSNEKLHPLQMYLYRVVVQQSVDLKTLSLGDAKEAMTTMLSNIQLKYAIIVFTTLPVIFTYPFFQKYFIKGALIGSLKE
ncbi:carbohydrate ABC transporter permease [Paenibacillus sp. J5C_2022]|uniref:carbohydrate ABC transporter permease n=1 Tax=Paenibacillus sp. J5C2022 TaxID=2977129 RepID=UPI0021D165DA|nr:carbohydrate ABC transporter permease [Paenibacillus sp. J5C2022]MCU6709103.1 carbohydrate ABC transporter permease [Paenibacillus sp. J5C2022]